MLTEGPVSKIAHIDLDADELLTLGDIFEHGDANWRITLIEIDDDIRKHSVVAGKVRRVTALRADMVQVKLTMTKGEFSDSGVLVVPAEKSYSAGSILNYEGKDWNIRAIHSGEGRTLSGKMPAHQIRRIYLHEPPAPVPQPTTPRERRQAWKEGRLGYNPNPIGEDRNR